ncbi:MAG: folate family ECF transporter S component [Clostridia bacterium]|nr:folate family ECF transporter S component [Clostridia bacterium]
MSKLKKVILSGILLALLIVLNRFISIKTPLLVISFSFVPIMMAAIWLGPQYSTLIAALGDFIGAILFPFGTYFPGFTVSAGLTGLIYGLFLYRKSGQEMTSKQFVIRLLISNLLVLGIVEIFVVSVWLKMMYGKAYLVVVSSRVLAQVLMFPIRIITIFVLEKITRPIVNRYLYEGVSDEND